MGGSTVGEDDEVGAETAGTDTGGTNTGATDGDASTDGGASEDHRSYFIGESTKFNGGGFCDNANLNAVTNTFRNELSDANWTGLRFVNENSWPEDYQEGTFSQTLLDGIYGDAAKLSVYAGHGNVGLLQWGSPSDNGQCQNFISTNSRLGTLAGDTAAAVMFLTSCTLRVDQLWPVFQVQASRQFFGYHNSPYIGYDEARKVFKRTQDGQPTADAWLEEMVLNVLGKNSPVVFTMGTSEADATGVHGMTNIASGEGFLENVGEPADNYFFEFYNSGCSTVCGNCSGSAVVPPEITLGTVVPRVKLVRPVRSADNLVKLATSLLALFHVGALDDAELARLEGWANAIVSSGDVTHALVLDEPRIDLSYDPRSDFLRVTDRDALYRARPMPGQVIDDPPDLKDALLLEATSVRNELQAIPGALDLLGTQFEVSTREVGRGNGQGPQSPPIPFEYIFTLPGRFEGLALPDRSLGIGVTRLCELSTLTVSMVEVEVVNDTRFMREPQHAIDALVASLLEQYPNASGVEVVEPQVGYALAEGQMSSEAVPSLLFGYVLGFGTGDAAVVSRRFPVRIALVELDAVAESLAALDPNPDQGDDRASN